MIHLEKKTGQELVGVMLVLLLFLNSDEPFKHFHKKLKQKRVACWIQIFELLILLYTWSQSSSIDIEELDLMSDFLPSFMDLYKSTLKRKKGNGLKIIKYHMMLHLCDDIRRHGPPQVFYGGIGENMLKKKNKKFAKKAKKQKIILNP